MTKNLSPSNAVDCNDFASLGHTYDAHSLRRNKNISQENQYQRSFVEQVTLNKPILKYDYRILLIKILDRIGLNLNKCKC